MTNPDPRTVASIAGKILGRPDLSDDIISGRMTATDIAPLLAGMVDGIVRQVFGPTVGIQAWDDFDPTQRPLVGTVTLLDGSRLQITISDAS